jgi:hypothetical protein
VFDEFLVGVAGVFLMMDDLVVGLNVRIVMNLMSIPPVMFQGHLLQLFCHSWW